MASRSATVTCSFLTCSRSTSASSGRGNHGGADRGAEAGHQIEDGPAHFRRVEQIELRPVAFFLLQ